MRETNSPVNQPVQSDADVETTIGLTDLWSMCITRWYWFLLSLVVALVVAVVYLMSAPVVYTRNASVLVKEDAKNTVPCREVFRVNCRISAFCVRTPILTIRVSSSTFLKT